jgi:hypothetical protein
MTRPEQIVAALLAGGTALLPPGASLAAAGLDLGVTMLATYRAVARIGALFGLDVRAPDGFRFVADSFALGCSSQDSEGLVAYLTGRKQRVFRAFTLGGVAYGATELAGYLWTGPTQARVVAEEGIRYLARLCGYGLNQRQLAKLIPIGGAVLAGISTYAFMESILDAASHLAAREALLRRLPPGSDAS